MKRLQALARSVPDAADLVLLGDSLAAGWPSDLLTAAAPGLRVFNFGLPGERIQNTLWRLDAIDTAHLRPRRAIVLLGTNNLGDGDAPADIVAGLSAIVTQARRLWRNPLTLLVSIPRRGPARDFREPDRLAVNAALAREAVIPGRVELIDADAALDPGGRAVLESDDLHVSRQGYALLTAALARRLG